MTTKTMFTLIMNDHIHYNNHVLHKNAFMVKNLD